MADEQFTSERQITGDDVISEILRNCSAGAFKIRYTTVLPCIYHVYLHPADHDMIRPVVPALIAEARAALIDHLEALNHSAKPSAIAKKLGLAADKQVEYRILDPDWTVEFHPDVEDKLKRGDLEIYSELASAQRPDFEGAMTRHVTKRRADGVSTSAPLPPETFATPATVATAAITTTETPFAYLRYQDSTGAQSFAVVRNQVVIGRGGKSFWVDLKLTAPPDVSREHCRIRRDPESGRFFIKDVSQYGTAVDGKRIPSSIENRDGEPRDKNLEVPLPDRCTLSLADVFELEFEASSR